MGRKIVNRIALGAIFLALIFGMLRSHSSTAPSAPLITLAVAYAKKYTPGKPYVVVIDWKRAANKHRLFIVDTRTHRVIYSWYTSHGKGSGGKDRARKFSNSPGSHKSSLGLMITAETYYSSKFRATSLRLDGLEPNINGNVRIRAIVIHPADYISRAYINRNKYPGRSLGCITLEPSDSNRIINMIKGGTLIVNNY